ncbi:MAG: MlaD family protein [Phycisphaerae bacterium]
MNPGDVEAHGEEVLPQARVGRDWKSYLFWVVPVAAVLLAGWFIYSDAIRKGPTLHIQFSDASGLQAGKASVEYRGAEVGEVQDIVLAPDAKHVDVTVSLKKSARVIAREHSKFWIVKPKVSAAQITGLGTIVSGDYITVEPGDGKPETKFEGLAQAPVVETPDVLRIVLLAERQSSLKEGTPVFYRGVTVGKVAGCELGPHSQTVRATVEIRKHFAPLVRMNSVFWSSGGINVNVGLTGADISAQSAKTLFGGGVDFATPDTRQKQAPPGTAFRLYDKSQDAWLTWSPDIVLDRNSDEPPAPSQQSAGAQ